MIAFGKQVVSYLLNNHQDLVQNIFISKKPEPTLKKLINKSEIKVVKIEDEKATRLARGSNHQGILVQIDEFNLKPIKSFDNLNKILVLVKITDMGNIGSIIRSAYSLGIDAIILSEVNSINIQGAIRASSGAIFDMPMMIYKNVHDCLNELKTKKFTNIGAALDGNEFSLNNNFDKIALFLGNESEGLPNRLIKKLDGTVSIKMRNGFDSLNVSSAAAILIDRITYGNRK